MPDSGSLTTPSPAEPRHDHRRVTLLTATALAVADMIGIGVFTSLGFQLPAIPSGFSILMLWIVGGIAALSGALAYAELSTELPRSGGEYVFLSRIYHPAIGFLAGWVSATVGFAAPVALAAMAFGEYFQEGVFPAAPPLVLGLAAVWLVTLVHLSGVRHGSTFQNVSTLLKVALILVFIVAGFATAAPQPVSFLPSEKDLGTIMSAPFAVSLVFVMYSYSGWNAATYIAGEVRDPSRTLPLAIMAATLMVSFLYVLLNAVFLYTAPMSELAGQLNVAQISGRYIFGETGADIVALLICVGLISSISAMMWIGPRVTMAMGEDFPTLGIFSRKSDGGVPVPALLFQLAVVTVLLLTQSFEAVLEFIQFSLTLCSFLAVLGVIVLRVTKPNLERPYRTWGYPITPFIFLAVTAIMLFYLMIERPAQSFASLGLMVSGLAVYGFSKSGALAGREVSSASKG